MFMMNIKKGEKGMMNFDRNDYVGKRIWLYPHDTYRKIAKIVEVDALGFTVKIVESNDVAYKEGFNYFISHSSALDFQILGT